MLLFGADNLDGTLDPDIYWKGFIADVERLSSNEQHQWVSVWNLTVVFAVKETFCWDSYSYVSLVFIESNQEKDETVD